MPTPIYTGNTYPAQQRYVEKWSPVTGYHRSFELEGHSAEHARAVMSQYINSGYEVTLTLLPDVAQLEIQEVSGAGDPNGTPTLDVWQIAQSDENKSNLENPNNVSALLDQHDKRKLRQALSSQESNWDTVYSRLHDTANEAALERLYTRMLNGATQYVMSRYILKHTTNAPIYHAGINISDINVDRIYTFDQVLDETQSGSYWLLPLPPAFATTLGHVNTYLTPYDASYYQRGALKRGANRVTNANQRQDITTEYWFGQWNYEDYLFYGE